MVFGANKAFLSNPFTDRELQLVDIPPPLETHEPQRPLRSYLVSNNMANQITTALSPLLPGAPRPSRMVEVERVRQVETLSQEPEHEPEQSPKVPPPPPSWHKG